MPWEHFSHPADVGIRGIGDSRQEAFCQAACAMTALVCPPEKIRPTQQVPITCRNDDAELLFADWLNALLYEMAVRRMVFGKFDVKIIGDKLEGHAWGEPLNLPRHQPALEVKAATYHELKVYKDEAGRWIAQCVVDV